MQQFCGVTKFPEQTHLQTAEEADFKAMEIAEWLTNSCGVDRTHAHMLETILQEEYWISSVDGLAARNAVDPNLLGRLKAPTMVKEAISNALKSRTPTNEAAASRQTSVKRSMNQRDHYETRHSSVAAVSPPVTPTSAAKKQKCTTTKPTADLFADILHALTKKGIDEQMQALTYFQHELKNEFIQEGKNLEMVKKVLDTLLVALEQVDDYQERFIIKVLEVVGSALTVDRPELQKHAVDEGVVDSLLALLSSADVQRRRLALTILGHLGGGEQKDSIIQRAVLSEVTKAYRFVKDLPAKEQHSLRHSHAEFGKRVIGGSTTKQFPTLKPLVKLVVLDIIEKQRPSSALAVANDAVHALVTINGAAAVEYLAGVGFIQELVERLTDSSDNFLWHSFGALACMALHCPDPLLPQIEQATPAIRLRLLDAALPHTVFAQGALLVATLCRRGTAAITRLLAAAPELVDCLFASLVPTADSQLRRPLLNPNAANSALALMYVAQHGNVKQLAQVLERGLYVLAFKVLAEFSDCRHLVLQTLQTLLQILRVVSKMKVYQDSLADFRADVAWGRIRALVNPPIVAHRTCPGQQQPPPPPALSEYNAQVPDSESALDHQDTVADTGPGKAALETTIHQRATVLHEAALKLSLVPSTFEP